MDKPRDFLIYIVISIFLGVWISFIIYSFDQGKDTPPLIAAKIPEKTKEFFRNLALKESEINIDFIKKLTKRDYDNKKDYGKKTDKDFKLLEDEYFIIYYHNNANELERAHMTILAANNAIPYLKALFGKYFYPTLVEGRKLPIYLANSREDYNQICRGMGFDPINWSAAITHMTYDNQGKSVCRGIVLSEMVYNKDDVNEIKPTLWHEMAHYVHFTAVDLTKKVNFYNWEYEGIASYFAGEIRQVPNDKGLINSIRLNEQTANYLDSYWVGDQFYCYLKSKYGQGIIPKLIQTSYTEPITYVMTDFTKLSFEGIQADWRHYCMSQISN